MKILVTGANGDIAISIYNIIRDNFKKKIIIDGTEINSNGKGKFYFDKIIQLPNANHKNFLKKSILYYRKYDLIIPTTEDEIKIISLNRKFYKNIKFLINNHKIINLFLDKLKTFDFLKYHKIGNLDFCKKLKGNKIKKFPVFLKTIKGSGNKNYHVINNSNKLKKLNIKNKKDYVFQEYIDSKKEYTACIYQGHKFNDIIVFERILDKDKTFLQEL